MLLSGYSRTLLLGILLCSAARLLDGLGGIHYVPRASVSPLVN